MAENREQDNNTVIPGTETEAMNINSGKVVNNNCVTGEDAETKASTKTGGINNLVSLADRTTDEKREIAIKGGKASGETRRKQRDMRKLAQIMLNNTMSDKAIKNSIGEHTELLQDEDGNEDKSAMALMMARMILEAQDGNTKASEFVRDTAGFKPEKNINLDAGISEADKELLEKVAKRLENKG